MFDYNASEEGRSVCSTFEIITPNTGTHNGVGMDNYLQQGIVAAKAGDKRRAFDLLTRAAEDPASAEQAWLWLSGVVNDDPERLFCLNNVLRINSANAAASRGAAMLRQKGVFPSVPVYPEAQRAAPAQGYTPKQPPSSKSSQVNSAAPARTQTVSAPVETPQQPQQAPSYETDWKKRELSGFYKYAVMELANKKSQRVVEAALISQGASPETAKMAVKDAEYVLRKMRREKYKKRMLGGLAWTIVGIIITCGTYVFADNLGGKFLLFYGAIIVGIINFVVGLVGWIVNI